MKPYQRTFKIILVLVGFDVIVLSIFVKWVNATPDVFIAELLIVPGIIVTNLLIGLFVGYVFKKKATAIAFVLNTAIASLIFHLMFKAWFVHYDNIHFERYYFINAGKQYEIILDRPYHAFTLSDISDQKQGSTTSLMTGDYKTLADSVILIDGLKHMIISHHQLKGYPNEKDIIKLNDKED